MDKVIGVTIKSILEMDVLKEATVLAGHAGLDRLITSMNVMEVPDIIDWVSKGELLVTTAYSIKDDVQKLVELIPKLNASGVVGLGIKSKRYIKVVPKEVIEIADRLSFPIFDIPPEVSFSKIITPVLSTIVDNQTKVLTDIYDLQRALTATMLSGGNLQEISQTLYQKFGNSIAIYNDFFSSYVISTTDEKRDEICRIIESEKKLHFTGLSPAIPEAVSGREKNIIAGQTCNRIIIPIFSDKKLYGHIFMWEDKRELTTIELSVIESATSLIALDLVKKMSMFEMENNHKAGFLDNLLSSDEILFNKAICNAGYFDFNLDVMHQVVIIQLHGLNKNFAISSGTLYRINNNIVSLLRRLSKNTIFKMMFVNKCDNIILLCESTPQNATSYKQEFATFIRSFTEELGNENLENLVNIGIGRSYEKASELWRSLAEARRAASCGYTGTAGRAVYFEEMGVLRFLSYEDLRPELALFYNETLKVLVDYDRDRESELVKTLTGYFRCGGNLKKLAEEMFVHYNTIVYRIQRIRELTGSDLSNSEDLLNFQIAIKIHEMEKNE